MLDNPTHIGRFEVIDRLGQGGMGVLYLARDPKLERQLAIKVLRVNDPDVRRRFLQEGRSAARLSSHPNIVTMFDVGEHDGQPFLAMEYVAGETLSTLIRRKASLPLMKRLQIIEGLCDGLGFAHNAGVIHRDIKPANLILSRDGHLKILDFGIARVTDSSLTLAGTVLGTPNYMAPEQVEGREVDKRADIFAVGLVFYELLSYKQAFPGTSNHVVAADIVNKPPAPLATLVPNLDQGLIDIVAKTLRKRPSDRYQDLGVLRAEIARFRARADEDDDPTHVGRTPLPSTPAPTPGPRSRLPDREELSRRRAAQVELRLGRAREALASGALDQALDEVEQAATIDPDGAGVLELFDEIHRAQEERQADDWLAMAREELANDDLTKAQGYVDQVLEALPDSSEGKSLADLIRQRRDEAERLERQTRAAERALSDARRALADGDLERAIRSASDALVHDPGLADARGVRDVAEQQLSERRAAETLKLRAQTAVANARFRFGRGQHTEALAELRAFAPPHDLVTAALEQLLIELQAIELRRAEDERRREVERRQREEDARRQEEARRELEVQQARAREEERLRKEDEARRRQEEERQRAIDLERRRKEEEERQRLIELERQRKEEEERQRAIELERRRKEEEERQRAIDLERRRKEEEERQRLIELERQRKEVEERQRAIELERRRKEEEERQRAIELERRRKEEEERQRAIELERRRKEEEERQRAIELERRRKEEEERQRATELKRLRKEEEERRQRAEEARRREEEETRRQQVEARQREEALAREAELARQRAAAAEQARLAAEALARKQEEQRAAEAARVEQQRQRRQEAEEARQRRANERRQAAAVARERAEAEREEQQREAAREAARNAELKSKAQRQAEESATRRRAQIERQLSKGDKALKNGAFDEAAAIAEAIFQTDPAWPGLAELRARVDAAAGVRAVADRRRQELQSLVAEATSLLAAHDLVAARRAVDRAMVIDPADPGVTAIQEALAGEAEQVAVQRRGEEHARLATALVADVERQFADGDHETALARLAAFAPPHDLVTLALTQLSRRREQLAEARRHAEAERVRLEAEEAARVDAEAAAFTKWAQDQCELGEAAMDEARWDDALKHLFDVQRRDPGFEPLALLLDRARRGAAEGRKARELHDATARATLEHAEARYFAGEVVEAIALLAAVSPPHPTVDRALREWRAHVPPRPRAAEAADRTSETRAFDAPTPARRLSTDAAASLLRRVDAHLSAAQAAMANSDRRQAELEVQLALRLDPRNAVAKALQHDIETAAPAPVQQLEVDGEPGRQTSLVAATIAIATLALLVVVLSRNC